MESTTVVKIESLEPYRHLFPAAKAVDTTVKMGASVSDTVEFIPMIVKKTQWQVTDFVNQELRGLSTYSACEKLWYFVKTHIRYKKDERGIEQVRSPRRLIHDGAGDCDCFTTFIDTCLTALNIPVINRITKYEESFFQHIYPIVPLQDGSYITMDCVVSKFNYEEPYTEKQDFKMDLQYLDGIEETENSPRLAGNVDAQDLFGWENEMGDFGKLFNRHKSTSAMPEENQGTDKKHKRFQKIKNIAKKTLNVFNKANPATALLRAGILASMKLNVMKVAQRLKWAYLTENEAKKKGADVAKFGKLKNILYKMEQIFFTAGGKPENLKKAILAGRGNRNKEVSGLGIIDNSDVILSGMDENTALPTLLGDVYHDEFVSGLEGTEGLGVIVASTSIAAASGIMGSIALLIKSIGNIFPHDKNKAGADFENVDKEDGAASADNASNTDVSKNSLTNDTSTPVAPDKNADTNDNTDTNDTSNDSTNGTGSNKADKPDDGEPKGFKAFWENNKKWIKPVGITVAITGVLYAGYRIIKGKKENKPAINNGQAVLSGFNSKQHKKRKKGKQLGNGKKSNIALM